MRSPEEERSTHSKNFSLDASEEWMYECHIELIKAKKRIAKKIYKKYGEMVTVSKFLSVDLYTSLQAILQAVDDKEEALRRITHALDFVQQQAIEEEKEKKGVSK